MTYFGWPAKLGKILASAKINSFPALLHYARMLYANLFVKFKQEKIATSNLKILFLKLIQTIFVQAIRQYFNKIRKKCEFSTLTFSEV